MPRKCSGLHKLTHQDGGNDEISLLGLSGLLGDSQTPLAHKTSHQDGGADELTVAGLAGQQIAVPYNGKIADITHANTDKHFLDLATALSETRKIIAAMLRTIRITGTGWMLGYPNEGTVSTVIDTGSVNTMVIIANATQRFQYALSVSGDDFDLYCQGYVVEA